MQTSPISCLKRTLLLIVVASVFSGKPKEWKQDGVCKCNCGPCAVTVLDRLVQASVVFTQIRCHLVRVSENVSAF